jgi:hypothetical protein
MSKLISKASQKGKIHLIETEVNRELVRRKSPLVFKYWELRLLSNDFNRVERFYNPTIFFESVLPIEKGDRLLLLEIDNRTLNLTGNSCYRFVNSIDILAGLFSVGDWYRVELSVLKVAQH